MVSSANTTGNSRPVSSSQEGPHPDLEALWKRRRGRYWLAPLHPASVQAMEAIEPRLRLADRRILDSGCGTGQSTSRLAIRNPEALVIGIDKSAHRLSRAPQLPDNAVLVRADVITAWRWLHRARMEFSKHYLLYPNPWPKAAHLARRWHGHPVFPDMLSLAGRIELRSNWKTYLQEFAFAAGFFGCDSSDIERFHPDEPLTPFERKYLDSGHVLHRLTVQASNNEGAP